MKDLKVLSSSINPGFRRKSIHNVDSTNTAFLVIAKNVLVDGYHPKCVYIPSAHLMSQHTYDHTSCIVCKNLETEGSKDLGTTTLPHGVVIT